MKFVQNMRNTMYFSLFHFYYNIVRFKQKENYIFLITPNITNINVSNRDL